MADKAKAIPTSFFVRHSFDPALTCDVEKAGPAQHFQASLVGLVRPSLKVQRKEDLGTWLSGRVLV